MDTNTISRNSKILFGGLITVLLILLTATAALIVPKINLPNVQDLFPTTAKTTITPSTEAFSDNTYRVLKIIDGDTIIVDYQSKQEKVRFIGIDTPELKDSKTGLPDCYAYEAKHELDSRLNVGENVYLEFDSSQGQYDKYQRLLAYVYRAEDKLFLNEELLQIGAAREYTYAKPYRYQNDFKQLESRAKTNSSGLWGSCTLG